MLRSRSAAGSAALCLAPLASAQSITPLVLEGDAVPGVGNLTSISNLAVNSAGTWMVEADTDQADTNADLVLLKDGALYLREGQMLSAPPGATLDSLDSVTLDASGRAGFNHFLSGTAGTTDDSGIYRDDVLVLQEGTASSAPELSPGTPYIGFFDVKIDDSGHLTTIASVDDVNIASTVDRVLARFELTSTGVVISETVLWKEGDVLPGQIETIADFGTDPGESDVNGLGEVMFVVDLNGLTTSDGAVYLGSTLLAQEGSPSPVPGRNWSLLTSAKVGLNDLGQHAFSGTLDGDTASNLVIVKNGAKLVQEGDSLPAFAPFLLTGFGSGPVRMGADGRVLWYGDWNDPDTDIDTGLFLDDVLLVQEGVTTVNGVIVDTLSGIVDGYALSRDGGFVIFEAVLADGREGAFLIDLQPTPAVAAGADQLRTPGDHCTYQSFSGNPIPAGFFGPGSLPFDGNVLLRGEPLSGAGLVGGADTIVRRLADAQLPSCGSSDTVPIEIVALHLRSLAPIQIDFGGSTSQYDVQVCLSSFVAQSPGVMTITQTHAGGGEYTSSLPVVPRLEFTKVSGAMGVASAVLDPAPQVVFDVPSTIAPVPGVWVFDGSVLGVLPSPGGTVDHDCDAITPPVAFPASTNFTPGIAVPGADCLSPGGPPELQLQREEAALARHCVVPTAPPADDVPYCFCYPEVAPCANEDLDAGCVNSIGSGGQLVASGTASLLTDTLVLTATSVPNQPGLFFQGTTSVFGFLGDGNRCTGGTVVRLVTVLATGNCAATDLSCGVQVGGVGGPISQHPGNAGLMAGDTRYYQFWYRDPSGPCGFGFNLTNAHSVLWGI